MPRIKLNEAQKEIFDVTLKIVLGLLATGAILAVALTAPKILELLPRFFRKKYENDEPSLKKIINKIQKDRYVCLRQKGEKQYLEISIKGKRRLVEYNIDTITIRKQKWDGKWRLAIFDIPEKYRLGRDVLREKLKEIGFMKMQKSVWVCPYECENEIAFISSVYEIERFVDYVVAERIDNSKTLTKYFKL